ncbi:MAG: hypothetical protein EA361_05335 [Bacteroidetes bacterium]|nr:MAG: hypothetical protein EA361_05335 [Bacteroidota bacterium]
MVVETEGDMCTILMGGKVIGGWKGFEIIDNRNKHNVLMQIFSTIPNKKVLAQCGNSIVGVHWSNNRQIFSYKLK